jgi:hypothetical protein
MIWNVVVVVNSSTSAAASTHGQDHGPWRSRARPGGHVVTVKAG